MFGNYLIEGLSRILPESRVKCADLVVAQRAKRGKRSVRSLRFAIICESSLKKWQAHCLKSLLGVENTRLVLAVVPEMVVNGKEDSVKERRVSKMLFEFYSRILSRPRASREVDMDHLPTRFPLVQCAVAKVGKVVEYDPEDVVSISAYDLDFILYFGSEMIGGEILNASRYGIWSFLYGGEKGRGENLPCFWEVYNGDQTTEVVLRRLTGRTDEVVPLKKGFFKTQCSYPANLDEALFGSSGFPAQVCRDILNEVADYLEASPFLRRNSKTRGVPGNLHMLRFVASVVRNSMSTAYSGLVQHPEMGFGIVDAPINVLLDQDSKPKVRWYASIASSKFLADPFGIIKDDRTYVFCEEFDYSASRGRIVSLELTGDGSVSIPSPAIELPFHVSYPYLVECEGEICCIPETYQAREVSLYKATSFPHEWKKVATLIADVPAVDSTLFRHDGHWWITCTMRHTMQEANLKLFIYHAPELYGPWRPHLANPVKVDVRSSRPAGTPFIHEGELYRPAQDCSGTYGKRIILNRIVTLTQNQFEEVPAAVVEPFADSPYPDGVHTVSALGNRTIIDGKRMRFIKEALWHNLFSAVTCSRVD